MPQPHKLGKDAKFGTEAILGRPSLAAHMGIANAIWARLDFWLSIIVVKAAAMAQIRISMEASPYSLPDVQKKMIWRSAQVAATMYLSLSGSNARDSVLIELLGPKDAERFEPIFKKVRSLRKRRNRFAHGICGIDPAAPDAIIVQDLEDAVAKSMGVEHANYFAYRENDFLELGRDTKAVIQELDAFQPAGFEQLIALVGHRPETEPPSR